MPVVPDAHRGVSDDGSAAARQPLSLLEPRLIRALRATFEGLARDPSVRVAVLTGAGRAFTAGMDVGVLRDLDPPRAKRLITALHRAIEAVHQAPSPVTRALRGPGLGAGLELALACDLRVAPEDARLGLPEVRLGLPSVVEAALLPLLVGPGRAAEMLFSGEPVSAARALEWGLVNRVVAAAALREAVEELAGRVLAGRPAALRLQQELVIAWRSADLRTAIGYGINAFAAAYATGEPREGASAFLEKRPPRFEGAP